MEFKESGKVLFKDGEVRKFDITIIASGYDPWAHYSKVKRAIEKEFGKPVKKFININGMTMVKESAASLEEIAKKEIQKLRDSDKENRFPLFNEMTDEEILNWVFRTFWDSPAMGN